MPRRQELETADSDKLVEVFLRCAPRDRLYKAVEARVPGGTRTLSRRLACLQAVFSHAREPPPMSDKAFRTLEMEFRAGDLKGDAALLSTGYVLDAWQWLTGWALRNPAEWAIHAVKSAPFLQAGIATLSPSVINSPVPVSSLCDVTTWAFLADCIDSADRLDVAGILPLQLIAALQDKFGRHPRSSLQRIRYITMPQTSIYAASSTLEGHAVSQEWAAALMGVRNLAKLLQGEGAESGQISQFAPSSTDVTSNCILRLAIGASEGPMTDSLYVLTRVSHTFGSESRYTVSQLADRNGEVADWLASMFAKADPIVTREVDCQVPLATTLPPPEEFLPVTIIGLSGYGQQKAGEDCLRPVALTVLRTIGREGLAVLLKLRSPLTDIDDFDRLSFLSARIREEDLASAFGTTALVTEPPETSLDRLWIAAGEPSPFVAPLAAYIRAAQRDVFGTTHLDIPAERFGFAGMHVVRREDTEVHLGFCVLTIDLIRTPALDEVAIARSFNPRGLREVPVRRLYTSDHPLNRFLTVRREWLMTNCLHERLLSDHADADLSALEGA